MDREFREADAGPDARLQAQRQSKMLEALFEVYFRVLKHCTTSGLAQGVTEEGEGGDGSLGWSPERVLRKFPLLYPTLEGLARYTHLISVDYFNDLMEVGG